VIAKATKLKVIDLLEKKKKRKKSPSKKKDLTIIIEKLDGSLEMGSLNDHSLDGPGITDDKNARPEGGR